MEVELNQVLRAASILGLQVEQSYRKVDNTFFVVTEIKKDGEVVKSFPVAAVKQETVTRLEENKQILQQQIAAIDADLAKIGEIK